MHNSGSDVVILKPQRPNKKVLGVKLLEKGEKSRKVCTFTEKCIFETAEGIYMP